MSLQETFKKYASCKNNTEATSADINQWCKDTGVCSPNLTPDYIDFSFNRARIFGSLNLTICEMDAVIAEMAVKYKDDRGIELETAKREIRERLCAVPVAPQLNETKDTDEDNVLPDAKKMKLMSTSVLMENVPQVASLVEILCHVERFGKIERLERDITARKVRVVMETEAAKLCNDYFGSFPLVLRGDIVSVVLEQNEMEDIPTNQTVDPEIATGPSPPNEVFDRVMEITNFRPLKMTTNGLYNLFSLYGKVNFTFLLHSEQKSWVSFEDKEQADKARSMLNGVELWGMPLKVNVSSVNPFDIPDDEITIKSCDDERVEYDDEAPSSCLSVAGIPQNMQDINVLGMLSQRGSVVAHLFCGYDLNKKTLHVQMNSTSEAIDAVMAFHGRSISAHGDERLNVRFKKFDF